MSYETLCADWIRAKQAEKDKALRPLGGITKKHPDIFQDHSPEIRLQESKPVIQHAHRDRAAPLGRAGSHGPKPAIVKYPRHKTLND